MNAVRWFTCSALRPGRGWKGLTCTLQEQATTRITGSKLVHTTAYLPFHTTACLPFKEDNKTTALTVFENLKEVPQSPTPALALGFSGLIPFVAAPVYMATTGIYDPEIAQAQLCYGASILSFLGGVRWGLTLAPQSEHAPDWHNLGYSVTPSLIAWAGLLLPSSVGVLTVTGGLLFAGYMDMAMWGYPSWFKGMRYILTFIAILSLWSSFVFSFVLSEPKSDEVKDGSN